MLGRCAGVLLGAYGKATSNAENPCKAKTLHFRKMREFNSIFLASLAGRCAGSAASLDYA
jgi:hypothetical protein